MEISMINKDTLIIDRAGLGMKPFWDTTLCNLIDLEASSRSEPCGMFIMRAILEGYSQREIARHLKVCHGTIQYTLRKIRENLE